MNLNDRAVWTIGGGKSGIGKTVLTASLGTACAREGRSVILVDANVSAPDLPSHLGIQPPGITLLDVIEGRAALSEAVIATLEPAMRFLSCVGEEPGMADLASKEQEQMAECIRSLDAEVVLVDVGTGTSCQTLDFFNLSSEAIVVTTPDPATMRCAFRFLRNATFRRVQRRFGFEEAVNTAIHQLRQTPGNGQSQTMAHLLERLAATAPEIAQSIADMLKDWQPRILINMSTSEQDLRSAEIIGAAARKLLNVDLHSCGRIDVENVAAGSTHESKFPDPSDSSDPRAAQIRQIARSLAPPRETVPGSENQTASSSAGASTAAGFNHDVAVMGRALHVQTEDLGPASNCIATHVFCEGRVLLSTKSEYPSTMQGRRYKDQLFELMRTQHFNVIRQIESRTHPHQSAFM